MMQVSKELLELLVRVVESRALGSQHVLLPVNRIHAANHQEHVSDPDIIAAMAFVHQFLPFISGAAIRGMGTDSSHTNRGAGDVRAHVASMIRDASPRSGAAFSAT
jgi:hypothetical protein